jgi:virginiamycin B lyase
VVITATGSTTVTRQVDLAPQATTSYVMNGLPVGLDVFTADAYLLPCASIAGQPATWTSDPVSVSVTASTPVSVTLTMRRAGPAGGAGVIRIEFPSGAQAATTYTVPTAASQPAAIGGGPDGNLWFAESATNQVAYVTTTGVFQEYPMTPGVRAIGQMVTGSDGAVWFNEQATGAIGRITVGGAVSEFPLPAGYATAIAPGRDGNLWYVTSTHLGRLTMVGVATEWALPVGTASMGLAWGADGNVWVTDRGNNVILKMSPATGTVTSTYPIPTASSGAVSIVAGPDGNLWFVEQPANQIGRVTTAGAITEFPLPTASANAWYICAGPDGNVWFTEGTAGNLGRITPAGVVSEFPVTAPGTVGGLAVLGGIAAGSDGNVWFTDIPGNKIGKFPPY